MESLHAALLYAVRLGIYNEWHPVMFWLNAILAPGMKGMVYTIQFIQKRIDARMKDEISFSKEENNMPMDFVSKFLHLRAESPEKVSKQDIESAAMNNFGAGSDTTSISLCAIIWFLCKHPQVSAKLREEIDEHVRNGTLSEPITYKEALAMPYLQAVIKESLRCHPAVGLTMARVVPDGGATISGTYFPSGVCALLYSKSVLVRTDDSYRPL
jgi:cytochrome P450